MGCCIAKDHPVSDAATSTNPLMGVSATKALEPDTCCNEDAFAAAEEGLIDQTDKQEASLLATDVTHTADSSIVPLSEEYATLMEEAGDTSSEKSVEAKALADNDMILGAHKKEVIAKIKVWKAEFIQKNGYKPKISDIEADSYISPIFEEYITMLEKAGYTDPRKRIAAKALADHDMILAAHKKEVMAKVKAWKAEFIRKNGYLPKVSDIEADSYGAPLFEEYKTLWEKSRSTNPEERVESKAVAVHEMILEAHKKEVIEKVKAWKTEFIQKNGYKPKLRDIEADSYGAPLYEEYITILEECVMSECSDVNITIPADDRSESPFTDDESTELSNNMMQNDVPFTKLDEWEGPLQDPASDVLAVMIASRVLPAQSLL